MPDEERAIICPPHEELLTADVEFADDWVALKATKHQQLVTEVRRLRTYKAQLERLVGNGIEGGYLRDACLDLLRQVRAYAVGYVTDAEMVNSTHWNRLYDLLTASIGKGIDPTTAIVIEVWRRASEAAGLSAELPGVGPHDRGTHVRATAQPEQS